MFDFGNTNLGTDFQFMQKTCVFRVHRAYRSIECLHPRMGAVFHEGMCYHSVFHRERVIVRVRSTGLHSSWGGRAGRQTADPAPPAPPSPSPRPRPQQHLAPMERKCALCLIFIPRRCHRFCSFNRFRSKPGPTRGPAVFCVCEETQGCLLGYIYTHIAPENMQ